jgi:hypothetical protein
MLPKKPEAKVLAYRIFFWGLVLLATLSIIVGLKVNIIHQWTAFSIGLILLATAFASSKTQFAKEVALIRHFTEWTGLPLRQYPTTPEAVDDLREILYGKLVIAAKLLIEARRQQDRIRSRKDDTGVRAAAVLVTNREQAFEELWDACHNVGAPPLKNHAEGIEWKSSRDFLKKMYVLGMRESIMQGA